MIDLLVQYARKHITQSEPGFRPKQVKWAVALDATGRFLSVIGPLGDPTQRNNPGQTFDRCPDLGQPELETLRSKRGAGAHFLVETAQVVALYAQGGTVAADPKTPKKHDCFVSLLRDAAKAMPELAHSANALSEEETLEAIRRHLAKSKAKPSDKMTLMIEGRYPVESDAWHDWWRSFRRNISGSAGRKGPKAQPQMIDLATGEWVTPASTHPKIIGLADVGGSTMGSSLVGYDKEAFTSYGLEQSQNGAMAEETAFAYRDALNLLLAQHSQRLVSAKVAHWYQDHVPLEDDPLAWLESPAEAEELAAQSRASELLRALQTGKRPDLMGNRYYALTLSGSGGRVMVRDWMQGSFEELVENINAWFNDLCIVRPDGLGPMRPPKFLHVLASLSRELDDVPAPDVAAMWRVAVRRLPIPIHFLAQALARVKCALIRDDPLNTAGMGLLKAYHIRKGGTMEVYLNEEHPEPAYHCGRLMAVLAALQQRALGDVGAGVVQRYYAAASATPALVLGRLTRTSQFHLNKLDPGLAHWYETRIASIWARIRDRVPPVLSLEQQSLFALGYYQQIAADRASRPTTETPERKENTDA